MQYYGAMLNGIGLGKYPGMSFWDADTFSYCILNAYSATVFWMYLRLLSLQNRSNNNEHSMKIWYAQKAQQLSEHT